MSNPKVWGVAMGLMCATAAHANLVLEHAQSAGVKRCLPIVRQLSEFLIEDKKDAHGAHSQWGRVGADGKLFTSVIERNDPNYTVVASMSVAPLPGGACTAVYEQIYNIPLPCAQAASLLTNHKNRGVINRDVSLYEHLSSDTVMIYMMQASNGCLVVKKEVWPSVTP